MADIRRAPQVRCDNCSEVEDQIEMTGGGHRKPHSWGELRMTTGKKTDEYGGVERLVFPDLCPRCARAVGDAVHEVLTKLRGERCARRRP